jgi:hypothetical protein
MKLLLQLSLLFFGALLTWSCACDVEEESQPSPTPPPTHSTHTNPFTGQPIPVRQRVTELPKDEYFQKFAYPGARVHDVTSIFGKVSAFLETDDEFEVVDAFYKARLADLKGETKGKPGRYYKEVEGSGVEFIKFRRRDGGGCTIEISK